MFISTSQSNVGHLVSAGHVRRRSKTTRMLMAVSFTYILTTLPLVVITITMYALGKQGYREELIPLLPWMQFFQVSLLVSLSVSLSVSKLVIQSVS